MKIINFEDTFKARCANTTSVEQLEQIDKDFTFILQKASKKVAERRRSIPFSKKKLRD